VSTLGFLLTLTSICCLHPVLKSLNEEIVVTVSAAQIDAIVQAVLAELGHGARSAWPAAKPQTAATTVARPAAPTVTLTDKVITSATLASQVRPGTTLRFTDHAILTPSAKDWLRERRVSWMQTGKQNAAGHSVPNSTHGANWHLVVVSATPTVQTLLASARKNKQFSKVEILGTSTEAASYSARVVATGEAAGVLVISEQAAAIACKANRGTKVRAAVASSPDALRMLWPSLSPNVVCVVPHGKSFIDLRNMALDCVQRVPTEPANWN
jgi:hypothetical protein